MHQVFRIGIGLLVFILVILGGVYLLDTHTTWRSSVMSTLAAIKRSVGIGSPVENDGEKSASIVKKQGQIYRCHVNGKTIYADVPCDGRRSKIVETGESTGIQIADPWEVKKYRAKALAAKITGETKPVPADPSRVSADLARCDKLEKYIGFLDQRARQPSSDAELESIKQEKKIWSQEQSVLDCGHS